MTADVEFPPNEPALDLAKRVLLEASNRELVIKGYRLRGKYCDWVPVSKAAVALAHALLGLAKEVPNAPR